MNSKNISTFFDIVKKGNEMARNVGYFAKAFDIIGQIETGNRLWQLEKDLTALMFKLRKTISESVKDECDTTNNITKTIFEAALTNMLKN